MKREVRVCLVGSGNWEDTWKLPPIILEFRIRVDDKKVLKNPGGSMYLRVSSPTPSNSADSSAVEQVIAAH